MKELRDSEREPIIVIPPILRVVVRRVEPLTIIVAIGIEKVRIAVRNARSPVCATVTHMHCLRNLNYTELRAK